MRLDCGVQGGIAEYYHADGLGSVRALTDGTGVAIQTYETDEFGMPTEVSGNKTQPFGYTGEQRDSESGLVYLRARIYDPGIGRFLGRDPIRGSVRRPLTLNRFGYVLNNPCRYADRSGLSPGNVMGSGCGEPPDIPDTPEGVNLDATIREAASWNAATALVLFPWRVAPGGEWDYKARYPRGSPEHERYAHFGNFAFGATGLAAGFSEALLLRGAGAVQQATNAAARRRGEPEAPSEGSPIGGPPHGDDPVDQATIERGFAYFRSYKCQFGLPLRFPSTPVIPVPPLPIP